MIRSHLRAGIALACALGLSACGGGDGDLYIGGSVSGNTKDGLAVTNNDGPRLEIKAGATSFVFPELVETDSRYNVKVVAWPDNTEGANGAPGCQVVEGTGTGRAVFSVSSVRIVCTLKTFPLTARISGQRGAGLELVNGADRKVVAVGETSVNLLPIPEGAVYGVTVLKSPDGQTCSVANGSGTMGTQGKTVDVTCAP